MVFFAQVPTSVTEVAGFWPAIIGILVALGALLGTINGILVYVLNGWQSARQEEKTAEVAKTLAVAAKTESEKVSVQLNTATAKIDAVHTLVDGEGLMSMMAESKKWQEEHEKMDLKFFDEIRGEIRETRALFQRFLPRLLKGVPEEPEPGATS